ncbi:unnamed protein product [Trifolium pratense]|uniref:Uncharacterized protein n=1 Tax=Trifolium pratense TaxID=57577 RepID=A0ACB0LFW8_TRIPR|nr:unnamed protein product [Trifolium pratense]
MQKAKSSITMFLYVYQYGSMELQYTWLTRATGLNCLLGFVTSSLRLYILSTGDLLVPLDVSSDDKVLPTTYGIETSTWQASIEGMVPYHNALHHHIESIILSCLESKADAIVDHLLQVDKQCVLCAEGNQRTVPAAGKRATRVGNIDHITRVANKLIHLVHNQSHILAHLQVRFLYIRGTRFMVFIVSTK